MTDYERDLAAGGKPVLSDYERDLAAGGVPAGYDPRPLRGMRPEPAPDDVAELATEKPGFLRRAFPRATERSRREDPISNDPLAAMIVQGIPAAGLGTVAAAGTGVPLLGGAAAGALQDPEHPIRGAALGAIPFVPKAIGQADRAIGAKALDIATRPNVPPGPVASLARRLGERAVHATVGHAVGGVPGMVASQFVSPLVHDATAAAGDKLVNALAARYLRNTGVPAPVPGLSPVPPLAPLVARGPAPITQLPPGVRIGPLLDEFTGEPLTNPSGRPLPTTPNHATVGGGTVPNGLRADVARDARRFADEPAPTADPLPDTLGSELAKSVQLLDDLRAGRITAEQAIAAGLPPRLVRGVR